MFTAQVFAPHCILLESDLQPISEVNHIFKFAHDTNLLDPEHTDVDMRFEYVNVVDCIGHDETK